MRIIDANGSNVIFDGVVNSFLYFKSDTHQLQCLEGCVQDLNYCDIGVVANKWGGKTKNKWD